MRSPRRIHPARSLGEDDWQTLAWPSQGPVHLPGAPNVKAQAGALRPVARVPAKAAWWAVPGALVGFVLATVGAAVGQALSGEPESSLANHPAAVADLLSEAGLWVAMLGTAILVSRRYGYGDLKRDYGLSFKLVDLLWGIVALVAGLVISSLVVAAFAHTSFQGTNNQILAQQKGNHVGLVIVAVVVSVGAPFFEELFFRGYLRTALQARVGWHAAVWLQAALFGLAHFGESATALGNVSVFVAIFGFGVVLGYTAHLTGRLAPSMVAHGLFNLVAVAASL
jgi:membrane protease YdiL (CAAX protease family)